ncbi:hypothetical protein OPV22_000638 [Ensete ventricosum]|uniref:Histidine-containing phosphotransfer protein n=1 Tax=Ensete ventricosum TaxID=4639 RepID=A0AAV8RVP6_ENSVE|nr:hypothetical protein OPV22_000638 [Ensete ventricosum]
MEYASGLPRQLVSMKKNLFDQGYLDEQFYQLEELQDESSPNFVEEVVTLFFRDSSRLVANIDQALKKYPQDFCRLDNFMHQLKGSASRCLRSFQKVKKEHAVLKQKLENYFQVGPVDKATRSGN